MAEEGPSRSNDDDIASELSDTPQEIWSFLNEEGCSAGCIQPRIVDKLFRCLKFHSQTGSSENHDDAICQDDQSYKLAVACVIKIIHLIHFADLENHHECPVDAPSLLKSLLEVINLGDKCSHNSAHIRRTLYLLDAIPKILECKDSAVLQAVFVGIRCFPYLVSVLDYKCQDDDEQNRLYHSVVAVIKRVTHASQAAKEVFKETVGFKTFCDYLNKLESPTQEFFLLMFDWAVEGDFSEGNKVINNVDVILLMLDWLPSLAVYDKRYVTERILSLCRFSLPNALLCSTSGVLSKVVMLLDSEMQNIDNDWAESLIDILESIGSHSVTSHELKQVIGLFAPMENGAQVPFAYRLLQSLVKMSFSSNRLHAKHFFDLHHPSAGISVPGFQKWPGNSFTFHAWVCLGPIDVKESDKLGRETSHERRIFHFRRSLYSFFALSGVGLEAFFASTGHLVIAVCHKKEYTTVTVPVCQFCDQNWHSIAIAHLPSRRPFGQSSVSVYVDGILRINSPMKFPSLTEDLAVCRIGSSAPQTVRSPTERPDGKNAPRKFPFSFSGSRTGSTSEPSSPHCSTITAGSQDYVWGVPTSLQGQLGPVCVFSEGLQEHQINALHHAGPNDLNLFQPLDASASTQPPLTDLTLKLVLFYNAKAGREHRCSDLTPVQPGRVQLDGRLTGHRCTTWDMKDVLRCIGGMKIFLPLLEQISFFEPRESANGISEPEEIVLLEKENEEKEKYERSLSSDSLEEASEKEKTEPADSMSGNINATACAPKQEDEWVFINDNHELRSYKREISRLCKSQNCDGVALFLFLLLSILTGHDIKDEEFAETLSYVGSILRNIDVALINVQVLQALQALVECVTNETVLQSVHENLLFDFRVWSSSEFNVRIGHIQFISTQIKDNPLRFRSEYGVRFFLDVITQYYGDAGTVANAAGRNRENEVELTQEEVKIIRASLLGLIKFYLTENVEREEVLYIVEYLTCVTDPEQIIEVLDVLLSLCERASKSKMAKRLSDPRHVPVFVTLLISHRNEPLRLKILKLMADIMKSPNVPDGNRSYWHLRSIGFSAVTEQLKDDISQPLVESLLRLGVSEHDENKGVDVLMHYHVVLAVLEVIENKGLEMKLFVSHMILRSLDANHLSLSRCANECGWHVTLLRLITGPFGRRPRVASDVIDRGDDVSEERIRGEEDLIGTVLEIIYRVMWKGVQGFGENDWTVRGQAIAAVSIISSAETFLVPPRAVERRLLELCLQGAVEDITVSGQTGEAETQNALMVMRLVEDFIFSPACIAGTGDDDYSNNWSIKLVENVVLLLEVLNVWDENKENVEWTEMAQVGVRILLAFISQLETEFCATASAKLSKLVKARQITSQGELCYILGRLHQAFVASKEKAKSRNYSFIVPVIRILLLKYHHTLPLTIYVPTFYAADGVSQQAQEDFLELIESEEFKALMKQQIYPGMKQYETAFSQSSLASGRFLMDCLSGLTVSLKKKEQAREESQEKFDEQIAEPFKQLQDSQRKHVQSIGEQEQHVKSSANRQWKLLKRTLKSERSPWASRVPSETHWKLSYTENFQRMRLKLTRNYSFNPHTDASHARDNISDETDVRETSVPVRVAKEAVVQNVDEDVLDVEEPGSPVATGTKERVRTISETEKSILGEMCELVTLMDIVPGKFEVTTTHVYFYADDETAGRDFQWPLSELREVHLRRHNLRRSALEFFLVDQTNYFLNFNKEIRNKVYRKIMSLRPRNLYYIGARSPAYLLKTSGLTDKWVHREISNFEYLMQLNTISGRTYNDLSQYPVFPWILLDYTSEELRLDDPAVYRDLSKPVGALNAKKSEEIREKYDNFQDPTGEIAKFHYGSHYSSSAGVLYYMLRVEPFTTLHIKLQSSRFDCADRQFQDIPSSWNSIYCKASDVKELIPEFFYFPDFLLNSNRFDLGYNQRGDPVGDVVLPRWATSPEDFVYKHRQALESDHVSAHLHEWIDLIFGYKQKGPEAEKALNVFYYCCYEGAVDLDAITDSTEREATEGMINNFGQTPTQLLTQPHPQRMSADEAARCKAIKSAGTSKTLDNVFKNLKKLKPYFVTVSESADPLVFAAVSKLYTRSLIYSGMPEHMITISQSGILGVQNWLPFSKERANPFTFDLDPSLSSNKLRRCIAGPFITDLEVSSRLFAVTHDAKLIITAGHWDNSFRVFNTRGKLLSRIVAHTDVVTCLSLDNDGHHLITGSRDSTCRLWGITQQGGVAQELIRTPLQTLYGHDQPITCVAVSWELDMAVSGSQDGTVIIYTARKGEYVITLRPMEMEPSKQPRPCHVTCLALSDHGDIVVFCEEQSNSVLRRYSINGKDLSKDENLKEHVVDLFISGEFLVTGGVHGRLEVRSLHSFQVLSSMKLLVPIRSVSLARDSTHLFVCLHDGKLIVVAVDNS